MHAGWECYIPQPGSPISKLQAPFFPSRDTKPVDTVSGVSGIKREMTRIRVDNLVSDTNCDVEFQICHPTLSATSWAGSKQSPEQGTRRRGM